MSKGRYLTLQQLKARNACPVWLRNFRLLFGERVYITEDKAELLIKTDFPFDWLAYRLDKPGFNSYDNAMEKHWAACEETNLAYKANLFTAVSNYEKADAAGDLWNGFRHQKLVGKRIAIQHFIKYGLGKANG